MRRLLLLALTAVLATVALATSQTEARSLPITASRPDLGVQTDVGRLTVHVPARPTTVGVVVLHSYAHTDAEPVEHGWSAASDRYGFVALYPFRGGSWNAGTCCGAGSADNRDDVGWLDRTLRAARDRYGLTSLYLAGFSNGGMMAQRLVAERPDLGSRLVTWGASPSMPSPGRWPGLGVLYSGRTDATVPVDGGQVLVGGRPTLIRPMRTAGEWLQAARLQVVVVEGSAHTPPPSWPDLAWRALSTLPGRAPTV